MFKVGDKVIFSDKTYSARWEYGQVGVILEIKNKAAYDMLEIDFENKYMPSRWKSSKFSLYEGQTLTREKSKLERFFEVLSEEK